MALAATWNPLLSSSQPPTHVAVVNVEDVHFGRRLDFLDSGPVPAMASGAELKGQPRGVNLPGAPVMAGERAQPFPVQGSESTPVGVRGQGSDSMGALWSPFNGIRAQLGAEGGRGQL